MPQLTTKQTRDLALLLYDAEVSRTAIDPLTDKYPAMTVDEATLIQLAVTTIKTSKGARQIGYKGGFFSRAIQVQMGINQPDWGVLVESMLCNSGDVLSLGNFIHPKVEPELAFVLGEELRGPAVTAADVIRATKFVLPALEVIDSRFKEFKFKLADVIADNASASRVVIGAKALPLFALDLRLLGVVLEKNGDVFATATGAAVMGGPAGAIAYLANEFSKFDIGFQAGEIIIPSALTAAVDVSAGDHVCATFDRLGSVSIKFTP
jgi:2-keto-4-pentenoate hydratase